MLTMGTNEHMQSILSKSEGCLKTIILLIKKYTTRKEDEIASKCKNISWNSFWHGYLTEIIHLPSILKIKDSLTPFGYFNYFIYSSFSDNMALLNAPLSLEEVTEAI